MSAFKIANRYCFYAIIMYESMKDENYVVHKDGEACQVLQILVERSVSGDLNSGLLRFLGLMSSTGTILMSSGQNCDFRMEFLTKGKVLQILLHDVQLCCYSTGPMIMEHVSGPVFSLVRCVLCSSLYTCCCHRCRNIFMRTGAHFSQADVKDQNTPV